MKNLFFIPPTKIKITTSSKDVVGNSLSSTWNTSSGFNTSGGFVVVGEFVWNCFKFFLMDRIG